ncbi:MAG TPA: FAD-binding oxidoreductase [Nitrososphaeraceae archaeon]|nr:FAD-binding oxidoreductase [Nitrososphaeraceae archaeon]
MEIKDDLERVAKGEILSDSWSTQIYSVDASNYEIKPLLIVCPESEYDIQEVCRYCFSKNLPITARGAGTGLLGQSLSDCVLIDCTKHMNNIIEIADDYVITEPGIVKGVLDRELKKKGKFLPPDPASTNYCTIGGMIANNSSGSHSLGYGNTIDFLKEVRVIYSDGSYGSLGELSRTSYGELGNDRNGELIKNLLELLSHHSVAIKKYYPRVSKNSCGYRLDALIDDDYFSPQKVFAASEGTLGIVTSAKMKIIDIPTYRHLSVLGFDDLLSAVYVVPLILQFNPTALELLDHSVFSFREMTQETGNNNMVSGSIDCLLFVEFAGEVLSDIETNVKSCLNKLSCRCTLIESAADEQSIVRIWQARKNALNRVMKLTIGSRKPVGLIEDTVVSPYLLYEYTEYLQRMYARFKLGHVFYGHAGDGNLHTRPLIDLNSKSEIELLQNLAQDVFNKVIRSGGTITGEHGDGLARTRYIEQMYTSEIVSLFKEVKKLFDPKFIMNPGKKVIRSQIH